MALGGVPVTLGKLSMTLGGVLMTLGGVSIEVLLTLGADLVAVWRVSIGVLVALERVTMTVAGGEGDGRGGGAFFFAAGDNFLKERCALDFALRVVFLLAAIVVKSGWDGVE